MTIDCDQPGTILGTVLQMIGSRNTVPPRMLRMVPLGLFHIFLSLNSKIMTALLETSLVHIFMYDWNTRL